MYLTTNTIIIREFNLEGVGAMKKLARSRHIKKWLPGWAKCCIECRMSDILFERTSSQELPEYSAIVEKASNAIIGIVDCNIHDEEQIGVNIVMDSKYIKRGYMTDAYKLFILHIFDTCTHKQVEIIAQAKNFLEVKAIEKLGAELVEKNRSEEGQEFNHYLYRRFHKGVPLYGGCVAPTIT